MSRVAVYGAGAIGGYMAWKLARAGHAVSVVARGAHLAAIRKDGLILEPHGGERERVSVAASEDPGEFGEQDVVLVTLKHPSLSGAVEGLSRLAGPATAFVFATNGIPWWADSRLAFLDPGGRLADAVPRTMRIGCVVKASMEVRTPGIVSMDTGSARFIVGPACREATKAASATFALLDAAGLQTSFAADLLPAVWDKLLLNVGVGLPAALLGLPVGVAAQQPETQALTRKLLAEMRAVARSQGVATTVPDDIVADPAILSSLHLPSLLQDLQKGRAAEIDALVTAPIRIAQLAQLPIPVLSLLGALLTAKARGHGCYDGPGIPADA